MRLHVHWHRFLAQKGPHGYYECRCGHRLSRPLNRRLGGPLDRSWLNHETDDLHRPLGPPPPLRKPGGLPPAPARRLSINVHLQPTYPHEDGDVLVLGPECFVSKDRSVISWRGENYVSSGVPL